MNQKCFPDSTSLHVLICHSSSRNWGRCKNSFFLWSDADKQCAALCNISKKQRPRFQKKSRIPKDGNGRQRFGKSQERCLKVNMLELLFIIQVLHRNTVADGGIVGLAGQKKTHSEGNNRIELTKWGFVNICLCGHYLPQKGFGSCRNRSINPSHLPCDPPHSLASLS